MTVLKKLDKNTVLNIIQKACVNYELKTGNCPTHIVLSNTLHSWMIANFSESIYLENTEHGCHYTTQFWGMTVEIMYTDGYKFVLGEATEI